MKKIIVVYTKGGKCWPDEKIDANIDKFLESLQEGDNYLKISNELVILALRAKIHQGKINHEDIVFRYKNYEIYSDKYGGLDHYPQGFCAYFDIYLAILLGWDNLTESVS